jgi:hypothetical protein
MPIIRQKLIRRADLRAHRGRFYVFGDNAARSGLAGQAGEMRGEPNAIGVATKWYPSMSINAFFSDADFDRITTCMSYDLRPIRAALAAGRTVVIPADGLGTGLAQLPQRAPRINAWLVEQIAALEREG